MVMVRPTTVFGLDLHAHHLQAVDLLLHDGLGQTELGDAVYQHTAGKVQRLEHGDVIALLGQITRAGQAGGAGADDGDLVAVARGLGSGLGGVGVVPVGDEALETADADGLALLAAHAMHLALALLRTDTAADGGQGGGLVDDLIGALEVPLGDLRDELGDADVHRAAVDTGMVLAVEAARGLVQRLLLGIAQRNLVRKFLLRTLGSWEGMGFLFRRILILAILTLPPA